MKKDRSRLGGFYWMADWIMPGAIGPVVVDHFDITPDTWQGFNVEQTRPGTYCRLRVGGTVIMSDTDMELRTNADAVFRARGDVLIGGLGIGAVALPILLKPAVTSVTIVEQSREVIRLVADQLRAAADRLGKAGPKLTVLQADIRVWRPGRPGRQFDTIYFDIWPNRCVDDVEDHQTLRAAFRRYLRKGGWLGSWEYDHLRNLRRRGAWR